MVVAFIGKDLVVTIRVVGCDPLVGNVSEEFDLETTSCGPSHGGFRFRWLKSQ